MGDITVSLQLSTPRMSLGSPEKPTSKKISLQPTIFFYIIRLLTFGCTCLVLSTGLFFVRRFRVIPDHIRFPFPVNALFAQKKMKNEFLTFKWLESNQRSQRDWMKSFRIKTLKNIYSVSPTAKSPTAADTLPSVCSATFLARPAPCAKSPIR